MSGTPELAPGDLVANRFEIDRLAGSGGMGAVYRARDRYTGDIVALKLLQPGATSASLVERFAHEAQVLSELRHPAVVAHVAHGQTPDGQLFLAMEWLEGEDLAQRLARGPLAVRDCVTLFERVADALAAAHQRGVIHRDLKPSNLFLCGGQVARVKVLDFGVARRVGAPRAMTKTGAIVGTPEYMAPEQARGVRDLTPAADLFSAGCVLYECLAGQPPFTAEHLAAVLVQIILEEPPPIAERRPGLPPQLIGLLERLLVKDPDKRLGDAAALRAELAALEVRPEPPTGLAATIAGPHADLFAEHEQQLYSIVLAIAANDDGEFTDATPPAPRSATELPPADRQALLRALGTLGATAEFLANGTLVAVVPPLGSAQDQAVVATRTALLIKERWPVANVALATGRGAMRGRTAVGEVAELAAQSLRERNRLSTGSGGGGGSGGAAASSGVFVDALSAKLLEGRFALTPQPGGALVRHEERDLDASRPLLGRPTPCVGREAELGTLQSQLASCVEESEARAVLVTAAPGVGKSRLRHEFLRRVGEREAPLTVLVGRGDIASAGVPYGVLRSALLRLCAVAPSEPLEAQRERLRERVGRHLAEADRERVELFLGELCGVPFPAEGRPMLQAARQDPKILHDSVRRALLTLFAAECAAAPVLLVLDDLQWGDELTVAVLGEVLREQAGSALLVVAFARPQVHQVFPRLWAGHNVQEIPLKGLSRKASERLIQQVLGKDLPPDLVAHAVEQANGNALFLEELIRSIADGDARGRSDTVLAMLQARIGRLETGARRAVLAAAVLGQTFWHDGVAAIVGQPAGSPDVEEWLRTAVAAELVHATGGSRADAGREYAFRHALVRDAAYSLLTPADQAAGHRVAGEFLAAIGESDAAVVAEHFARSGDGARAARWFVRAATDRLEVGNYSGVVQKVARGLACGPPPELAGQLRGVESNALLMSVQHARMGETAEAALAHAPRGSAGWCYAIGPALRAALARQDRARAAQIVEAALATRPAADARVVYVQAMFVVQAMLVGLETLAVLQAIQQKLDATVAEAEDRDPTLRRFALAAQGATMVYREPRPWAAVGALTRCVALCEQAGDERLGLSTRGAMLEMGWLEMGDLEGVRRRLAAVAPRVHESQEASIVGYYRHLRALALCASPDPAAWSEAEAVVAPLHAHTGGGVTVGLAQSIAARVALLRGQFAEAAAQARGAARYFPHKINYVAQLVALQLRAMVGLGALPEAAAAAEAALAEIPRFTGYGVHEVELRLAAAEALHAAGDAARARVELGETLRQIALRRDDIGEAVWKQSYLTRNPYCARARALAAEWGGVADVAVDAS